MGGLNQALTPSPQKIDASVDQIHTCVSPCDVQLLKIVSFLAGFLSSSSQEIVPLTRNSSLDLEDQISLNKGNLNLKPYHTH